MFINYEHNPLDNDGIILCAGPKERQALEEVMAQHSYICFWNAKDFISKLHEAVQKQADCIEAANEETATDPLCAEDAKISFDKHLSEMCQEDVDKVFKHLKVFFLDRCGGYIWNYKLDAIYSKSERKEIYEEIIVPWLNWVRSAERDKSSDDVSYKPDTEVSDKSTVES